MATLKEYKFDSFMHVFNYGVLNTTLPKEEVPISFNVIDRDHIRIYRSTNSKKQMQKLVLDKISHMQVTKKVKIIEPYALFDYNFLKNNILSTFGVTEDRIFLKDISLNRDENISIYSITADVYPEIYSTLKQPFSLENLYYAFAGATLDEKKIIVDYFNSLKFKWIDNIDYNKARKLANEKELKFLNLDEIYNNKLKEVLDEAARNSYIIELFNADNPLLEIPIPSTNFYVDDLMSHKKLVKEKENQQLQKKRKNLLKHIKEDIDD